jgi:hypothetical protein
MEGGFYAVHQVSKEGVALDPGRSLRNHWHLLIRKGFRFFLIESNLMGFAEFDHGIVAISENIPETATLYRFQTLALAHPTLYDTSGAETNWISRTISGGTRTTLERRQKYIRATEVAHVAVAAGTEIVCDLSKLAVLRRILLFKNVI